MTGVQTCALPILLSTIFRSDNKYYFVTAVTKVRKEGYADIKDVAPDIRTVLQGQKAVDKKLTEVREQIAGLTTLDQVADNLGTTISHYPGLSFGSTQYTQNDPAFIGAASVADEGVLNTVKGTVGVYVFEVANRSTGNFFTESDAATQLARKASYHTSILHDVITNEAEIKDNRARFF